MHTVGRGPTCEIKLDGYVRISNRHCFIFCKQNNADPLNPYLEAWVEDNSANGTFLNKDRLKKNVPKLLHSGDELYLINPDLVRVANSGVTAEDVVKYTFMIMLSLPTPQDAMGNAVTISNKLINGTAKSMYSHMSSNDDNSSSSASNVDGSLERKNTVFRLLDKGRNINDFYVFKEVLGSGAAGMVYRGISKETGRDWAVKVAIFE